MLAGEYITNGKSMYVVFEENIPIYCYLVSVWNIENKILNKKEEINKLDEFARLIREREVGRARYSIYSSLTLIYRPINFIYHYLNKRYEILEEVVIYLIHPEYYLSEVEHGTAECNVLTKLIFDNECYDHYYLDYMIRYYSKYNEVIIELSASKEIYKFNSNIVLTFHENLFKGEKYFSKNYVEKFEYESEVCVDFTIYLVRYDRITVPIYGGVENIDILKKFKNVDNLIFYILRHDKEALKRYVEEYDNLKWKKFKI